MTGHRQGPKRKLQAGYRAPSLNWTFCLPPWSVTDVIFFIVECGTVDFLCAMRVFNVGSSSSPIHYLCVKFCFFRGLHCWASPQRIISYSITHSPSLFGAPETEACILEQFWGGNLNYWWQEITASLQFCPDWMHTILHCLVVQRPITKYGYYTSCFVSFKTLLYWNFTR